MKIYFYTNVGKIRTNNEDGLLIKCREENILIYNASLSLPIKKEDSCYTFIVVDGMGGTEKGEVATQIVLENLNKYTFNTQKELEAIFNLSKKQLEENNTDGGCAIAGIKINHNIAKIFNIGDCRVYKKNKNYAVRISKDHSLVEEMVDNGLITIEEAHNHPKSNLLTSSIMPNQDFKIFFKEEIINKNDIFLICSDGVWGELSIDELDECFTNSNIDEINKNLFNKLTQKKQKDNLSYILIQI
jgi:serine/threonine protein phosphatase PrpC